LVRLIPDGNCRQVGLLEFDSIEGGLPDDGQQGSNPNFIVVGNGDGDGAYRRFFLHDDVASAPAHFFETMSRQNFAHLFSGKDF
jgi:hypothetical protein